MNFTDKLQQFYNRYESFGKNLTINSSFKIGSTTIMMITSIIMTRDLMEANIGLYQLYVTSLVLFNFLLNFGLNSSATYYSKKSPEKINQFLSLNISISIFSSIIIALVLIFFNDIINFQSSEIRNTFFICYLFFSFTAVVKPIMIGQDKLKDMERIIFYIKLVYLFFILTLHYTGKTSVLNLCCFLIFEYFITSYLLMKKSKLNIFPLKFSLGFIKESLNFNIKLYLLSIMSIMILKSDIYILKYIKGNFDVGLYSIGGTILMNLNLFIVIVSSMMIPKLLDENNLLKKIKQANKLILFSLIISSFIGIVIYYLSPFLIELYFKKQNLLAVESLRILMIGFIFISMQSILNLIYYTMRVKKTQLMIFFIILILSVILNFIFIPKFNFIACSWISVLSYGFIFILSYIDLFYFKKKNWIKKTSGQ